MDQRVKKKSESYKTDLKKKSYVSKDKEKILRCEMKYQVWSLPADGNNSQNAKQSS